MDSFDGKPGVMGVATSFLGGYREFPQSLDQLKCPKGTNLNMYYGVGTSDYCNMMAKYVLQGDFAWLWIISGGYVFRADLVENLMAHDVDVVVPLVFNRDYPYRPLIYEDEAGNYADVGGEWLQGQTGLVKLTDKTCRPVGMLIKRQVFEQLEEPWFINGRTRPEEKGGGLWFCQQLHEHDIGLYLDLDNNMGTITHVGMRARRKQDGTYEAAVNVKLYD